MATTDAAVSGVVEDGQSIVFCPFDHPGHTGNPVVASVLSIDDDETEYGMGNELITYRCLYDHTWSRIAPAQIIRMVGHQYLWKRQRDRAEQAPEPEDVTRQQLAQVVW